MRRITVIILFLLPVILKAQSVNVDSLVNVLNTKKLTGSEKLALYHDIYKAYVVYDMEKASQYAKSGLELAEKENNKFMMSKFNAAFGRIYNTKSDYETALGYWKTALDWAVAAKDKELEADIYMGIGILHARQQKFIPAIEYFTEALSIYESIGDQKGCIIVMGNIASIHRAMGNNEKAIYYLEKAKIIAEETNDDVGKMQTYFELGAIYANPVVNNRDENIIEIALDYGQRAYNISSSLNNKAYQAAAATALAVIYFDYLKDYDMALKYTHENLKLAEELGDQMQISGAWSNLSNYYRILKRYKESEEFALKAWETDSTRMSIATNLLQNIVAANIALGNKDKATLYLGKFNDLIAMQIDRNGREIIADIETKYETEKKEMRIAVLEKERELYAVSGIAVVVVFLLGMGLLVYRHRLTIQKKKLAEQKIIQLEQEKKIITIQASLKAEKTERDLIAHDLHDSVSSLLTIVKNNMNLYSASEYKDTNYFTNAFEVLSKSITELRRVVYHLKSFILTKEGLAAALDDFCRFIPNAELHFKGLNRRFDPDKEYVLYDCACELINNTLKHSEASRIEVHLNIDEQIVYLSVADNGTGFDSREIKPGIGLDNIRSNLSAFGGHLDILSEPGKGTEANIEMKI